MPTYSVDIEDLPELLENIAKNVAPALRGALQSKIGPKALEMARTLSSGPYKMKDLRLMYDPYGPYSVADPHPPLDEYWINEQTGNFRSAWKLRPALAQLKIILLNTDPKAQFLVQKNPESSGATRMIKRPIDDKIEADMAPLVVEYGAKAIRDMIEDQIKAKSN